MNIDDVLKEYDALEQTHDFAAIASFLSEKKKEALDEGDISSYITLLNEEIGFYRETSDYQKSITSCRDLLLVLEESGLKGTLSYATSILNIANACRAASLLKESLIYYNEVLRIYNEELQADDLKFAPLYNNMALLFQEMGDHLSACDCLKKALALVIRHPEMQDKIAITHTNLALSLMKNNEYDEAEYNLNKAFEIFDSFDEPDYHYGAALSAMGEALFIKGDLEGSKEYYIRALSEIRKNTGFSTAYNITLGNLKAVLDRIRSTEGYVPKYENGLDLARKYYLEYGKPMIHDKFPEYEGRIAVGLVGEGSECYGFDDELSKDHDFGPGFCMFLTDEDYEAIGDKLQAAYDALPVCFLDTVRLTMHQASKRTGAIKISEFFRNITGIAGAPKTETEWLYVKEYDLGKVTNGEIFRDDLGEFTKIRKEIASYYPEDIYLRKLAFETSMFSQYGQYNLPRMLSRNDRVSATVCLSEFMQSATRIVYLLNRKYAPIYKWLHRGIKELDPYVYDALNKLSELDIKDDKIISLIDDIATYIYGELKKKGLVPAPQNGEGDNYLDHHSGVILSRISNLNADASKMSSAESSGGAGGINSSSANGNDSKKEEHMTHEEIIQILIDLEYAAFDKTENKGGRASCQDDINTFTIMRKSQYLTWTDEMILSYIEDFKEANERGWNLITEKYGRMEESTHPDEYEKIKDILPPISDEKRAIIEEIVSIQTGMMEEFALKFPKAAGEARVIHTADDTPYDTSYETYLRGEISTYSDRTLMLYGRFIVSLAKEGKNLAAMIIENSAHLYGYSSLEDMENKL